MPFARTGPLRKELENALPDRPFTIEFWDGTQVTATTTDGPSATDGPTTSKMLTIYVRSPKAVAQLLRSPGQLGLGRAYVLGDLDVDDIDAMVELIGKWSPPRFGIRCYLRLAIAAAQAAGFAPPGRRPAAELKPRGRTHSKERDARVVRHHYDVSNEFFALFLDESMTYSCGIFSRGAKTLEEAQEAKLDLICRKLELQPEQQVLDIGCGWGSFPIHAARNYGVDVLGITLSEPQAELARDRAKDAGLGSQVQIKVMDYRDLTTQEFDAIASIGMVEHVGAAMIDEYFDQIHRVLRPGGRVLNHGIALLDSRKHKTGSFSQRYVFPDGHPLPLPQVVAAVERAGFEALHVEGFRADYSETLRHWAVRLDECLEEAARLAGEERVRVWRLYLRAARNGFETGFTSVYQVLLSRAAKLSPTCEST